MSELSPADPEWWSGRIHPSPVPPGTAEISRIRYQSPSGSCAFFAELDDGSAAWIKALGNPQGDQVLVTELVCTGIGRLVGASVVDSLVVHLPARFQNRSFDDPRGHSMRAGPAYASRHLGVTLETDSAESGGAAPDVLAGLAALWDLLLGDDEQWLYAPLDESLNGLFSFDHSLWLDRGPGDWDTAALRTFVDVPAPLPSLPDSLPAEAIDRAVSRIRGLRAEDVLGVLNAVPVDWDVPTEDLETLGWLIWRRREPVARRLEAKRDA